jgi:hypothetical protein
MRAKVFNCEVVDRVLVSFEVLHKSEGLVALLAFFGADVVFLMAPRRDSQHKRCTVTSVRTSAGLT